MIDLDAIVLAGGRAARLGGISKPSLRIGHTTLLERALEATRRVVATTTVVVGPPELVVPAGVLLTQEHPPFGGPVAGIAAGLSTLRTAEHANAAWLVLLAGDLPHAPAAAALLLEAAAAAPPDIDGVHLSDADGRAQWLAGIYRRAPLEAVLAAGDPRDRSVRSVMRELRLVAIADPSGLAADVDTWEDVARLTDAEGAT